MDSIISMKEKIKHIIKKYLKEEVIGIKKIHSSQNYVFKVVTLNNEYCVKKYSKDAIKNKNDLLKRKEQQKFAELLNESGINTILPYKFDNEFFIEFDSDYYLIYIYYNYKIFNNNSLTIAHIKVLATNLAKIHKLNIISNLDCSYKKINIDFKYYIDRYKKIDNQIFELLKNNSNLLMDLINKSNKVLNYSIKQFCVSHNDYKPKNILWDEKNMFLIDFDASGYVLPTAALIETAFNFSKINNRINYSYFKLYIESYLKEYGIIKDDFKSALYIAMNGKLQWFQYIISECSVLNKKRVIEVKNMINELLLFYNNIERLYDEYNRLKS